MLLYLSPQSFPPIATWQVVAVKPDAVRLLNAMRAEDADVVDERQLFGGAVGEPDDMHDVRHHVRHVAKVIDR